MKIVITGGTGLLALNWAWLKREKYKIHLFVHNHLPNLEGVTYSRVPLDDTLLIESALKEYSPDLVIHTAGLTNVDECERNPELAKHANTDIAVNVAKACHQYGAKLVHISTDHLFSGDLPLVAEDEVPSPQNEYARTKLFAENGVMAACKDALVVRTNFYGWGHRNRASFSDWIINSLRKQQEIFAFSDVWFTPILIDHLVNAVHELVDHDLCGIYNVVGDDRITKYDFACKIAKQFDLDQELIKPVKIVDMNLSAKRPADMSLSNRKASTVLGHSMSNVDKGILALFVQSQDDRESGMKHSVMLGKDRN